MVLDFGNGGKPVDSVCREVSEGVFERKYAKYTVRLDCNEWSADFEPASNIEESRLLGRGGGYGGRGSALPPSPPAGGRLTPTPLGSGGSAVRDERGSSDAAASLKADDEAAGTIKTPRRPNFLFVMSDDVGWGDHSYNCDNSSCPVAPPDGEGGGDKCPSCAFCCAPTPHLDAMAKGPNSLLFHRAYAGSACCSPTRAAVLTGRAPQRSCIDSANGAGQTPAWAKPAHKQLPWGQFTLGSAAKEAGMDTFFMGKWHLGDFWPFDAEDAAPPGLPGYSHPGLFNFSTWFATVSQALVSG